MGNILIRSAKKTIKASAFYLGIFRIFTFFSNRKEIIPIILYHRVAESLAAKTGTSAFALRGLAVSKVGFERQIKYLIKNYKVISLSEYIRRRKQKESLRNCAVITFDDGFRDLKEAALGILERYNCPATVFIIEKSQEQIYWRHELYTILDYSQKKLYQFKVEPDNSIRIFLTNEKDKYKTLMLLIRILDRFNDKKRRDIFARLKEELGAGVSRVLNNLYLKSEDYEALLKAQIEIGAHSLSHRDLTTLDEENCKKEISGSLGFVREITGEKNISFSMPFGRINDRIIDYLRKSEASCTVTGKDRLNKRDENIYDLKRLFIAEDSLAQFVYKISGAQMFFNRYE